MNITKDPIYGLFWKIGSPIAVGMFFNMGYNWADTYFGNHLGNDVAAGLSVAFPIFLSLYAVAQGLGSATNALISNAIGAKEEEKISKYLTNALVMGFFAWLGLSLLLYPSLRSIYTYTSSGELTETAIDSGVAYVRIFIIYGGSLFLTFGGILNAVFNAYGMTKIFRNLLAFNFFLNLFLNPFLAFGVSINGRVLMPGMGVAGLAVSTVFVQYVAFFILLYIAVRKRIVKNFSLSLLILDKNYVKEIFIQSIPPFFSMINVAFAMFIHNKFVAYFGQSAVAAYGIGIRLEQMALLINAAVSISLMIIVSQNNGSKRYDRVVEAFWKALLIGFFIMLIVYGFVFSFAPFLVWCFNKDPEIVLIGSHYVRTQILTFYAYVILQCAGSLLQGIKRPQIITYNELYRHVIASFIFIYPLMTIFNWGIDGIWYGIAIKTWTAAVFILFWAIYQYRKLTKTAPPL